MISIFDAAAAPAQRAAGCAGHATNRRDPRRTSAIAGDAQAVLRHKIHRDVRRQTPVSFPR